MKRLSIALVEGAFRFALCVLVGTIFMAIVSSVVQITPATYAFLGLQLPAFLGIIRAIEIFIRYREE
jgi:hypothetical protein